ncbi:MAG: sialidase family protein, partial [Longimicrobiales bacterium]
AHWLAREGAGSYAYGVRIALSHDRGTTWSDPVTPHRDGTRTEHGFVTLYPAPDGGVSAVWLDGRNMAGTAAQDGHGMGADMTLRATTIGPGGATGPELLVDDRTCECCQTDVAIAADGPVLAYRNRSPDEIRDIAIARFRDGRWSEPHTVHPDRWQILACPVNGPAIAADSDRVAVAWFTAARDTPRVLIAFSSDGGETFGAPVRADDGDPVGRVDLLLLDGGNALLSWLERGEPSTVRVRRIAAAGLTGPATTVTTTSAARASGFPRMARSRNGIVFAWTVPGAGGGVRTALVADQAPLSTVGRFSHVGSLAARRYSR